MDAAVCRAEVCYPFRRKHGRHRAVKRREFITFLGGVTAAWPLAARAQRPSIPVIGFLDATTAADTIYRVSAFRDGLKEAGFIDGHNVAIEFRWAENKFDRLPALAADLAQRQVAVIVGPNTAMRVVRAATSTIPIVFVSGGDPMESGVTNLSRPGGNITGVSFESTALTPTRLGLLHALVRAPATIAWLRDPRDPSFEGPRKRDAARCTRTRTSTPGLDCAIRRRNRCCLCDYRSIARRRTAYRWRLVVQRPASATGGARRASWRAC